jgi:putative ABC transport system permease protein
MPTPARCTTACAASNPAALAPAATRIVRSIAPREPIENVLTVPQIRDESVAPRRLNAALVSSFGALAVIIAAVGIAAAYFATRLFRGLLFGVEPHDPMTLLGVAGLMGLVGIAACWLPALRAARIDPAVAIRRS